MRRDNNHNFPELPQPICAHNAKDHRHNRLLPKLQLQQIIPALAVVAKRFNKPDGLVCFFLVKEKGLVFQLLSQCIRKTDGTHCPTISDPSFIA